MEDTWRLWCKFLDEHSRFEDWLKTAEVTAANPESSNVLYTNAKEELKRFEVFQRQVHERLTQLELINKQYRRLSRENRTGASCKLRLMVQDGNQRWHCLQRRVAAVLRRLKHFTSQREEFEGSREGVLVWLTEMDLQLTNVEHFSQSHTEDKMRQLKAFQQEITFNTRKIDALIVFGENLIQKSSPLDAVLIEDELEELHSYCQEVFGRVARFHQRLVSTRLVPEEDRDTSDHESGLTRSPDVTIRTTWTKVRRRKEEDEGGVSAGPQAMCHLLVPPLQCSGRETPVSVDSIPLEWDHTVDVGGSSSHEEDEDVTFFRALSVKSVPEPPCWSNPAPPQAACPPETMPEFSSSSRSGPPLPQQGYDELMTDNSESISCVQKVKLILTDEEEQIVILTDEEEQTDDGLSSSNKMRTGGVEYWEQKQAQVLEQWQKLHRDLCDVTSWLGRALPKLERLQRLPLPSSIRDMEVSLRTLEEMQRNFNTYECLMISVNLSARHFLQGDSVELEEALSSANHSWAQACGLLESWERRLHSALLQSQEFHDALHLLLLWLWQAESRVWAVSSQQAALMEHRDVLTDLQEQLRARLQQVLVLQDISSHLLLDNSGEESLEVKEKVQVISNKLQLLQRQVAAALESEFQPAAVRQAAAKRNGRRDSSAPQPFLHRVLWAVLHLLLLFFLLLVLIRLVPASDGDRSCLLSNNFARSFYPMLHYTNGPPPT